MIKSSIKNLLVGVFSLVVLAPTPMAAWAQEETTQEELYASGISHYDIANETCSASGGSQGESIYVIGDSLTDGMNHSSLEGLEPGKLEKQLTDAGWKVTGINATPGISIGGAIPKLQADESKVAAADTVVVALGTNGREGNDAQDNIPKMIEAIKAANPDVSKIYWMNAYNQENSHVNLNNVIAAQASANGYTVIDFAAEVTKNPEPYAFSNDKVHLLGTGYMNMSKFLVSQVGGSGKSGNDPSDSKVTTTGGGSNTDYAGNEVWSAEEMAKIEANRPFYEKAAKEMDVPWELIAVIHRVETGLGRSNPGNGQGIYQFYNADGGPYPAGEVSDEEFQRQTTFAASRFNGFADRNHSSNAGPIKQTGTADNVIKDMLFSYNGRAGVYASQAVALGFSDPAEAYNGSPYVMNRADKERDPTVEPTKSNNTWGQIKTDNGGVSYPANSHHGAWVLYAALAGISGESGDCGGGASGNVNTDGYSFPVEPQTKEGNGNQYFVSELPCPTTNCHTHTSWAAFDLGRKPFEASNGAKVYAIYDAKVIGVSLYDGIPGCYQFTLTAQDGFQYYYTHTSDIKVQEGEDVKAGQELALIGPAKCVNAGSNPAHLHIHQLKDGQIVDGIVPLINKLYEELPEK